MNTSRSSWAVVTALVLAACDGGRATGDAASEGGVDAASPVDVPRADGDAARGGDAAPTNDVAPTDAPPASDALPPADVPTAPDAAAPDGSATPWPHEPAGFTRLTERPFDAVNEDGWIHGGTVDLAMDPAAPRSPPGVQRQTWPAGTIGSDAPGNLERNIQSAGVHALYVSYWIRVSDSWHGNPSAVNKLGFAWIAGGPRFFALMSGIGTGPLTLEGQTQGTPGGSRVLSATGGADATISRGAWHRVEFVVRANTAGNADGGFDAWLDERPVAHYADVAYAAATESHVWEIVSWYPIWGGTMDPVPVTQWIEIDHFYASGH